MTDRTAWHHSPGHRNVEGNQRNGVDVGTSRCALPCCQVYCRALHPTAPRPDTVPSWLIGLITALGLFLETTGGVSTESVMDGTFAGDPILRPQNRCAPDVAPPRTNDQASTYPAQSFIANSPALAHALHRNQGGPGHLPRHADTGAATAADALQHSLRTSRRQHPQRQALPLPAAGLSAHDPATAWRGAPAAGRHIPAGLASVAGLQLPIPLAAYRE